MIAAVTTQVNAFAFQAQIPIKRVATDLSDLEPIKVTKTEAVFRSAPAGYVVVHDFGAVVFLQVSPEEEKRILDLVLKSSGAEGSALVSDTFTLHIEPGAVPASRFDRVTVDALAPTAAEMIAHVIGQSVSMECYETDVDAILERISQLSKDVADMGRFRGRLRDLTRFIGTALHVRNRVVSALALLDAPAATWDDERIDRLFRELQGSFSIDERYRALDHKLSVIRDNLSIMVELTRHRRSMLLEAGIFLLILFEIALFIVKE